MPNVANRGLFARSGSAWKPPANIFAVLNGAWHQADYVWAYHNGAWQVIWGRVPAAAPSATATWVAPHSVRINIAPPAVNTNAQWIIRRQDGSEAGRVSGDVLTFTDQYPLISTTAASPTSVALSYTVTGTDGTTESTSVTTNTLNVSLDPATVTTAVSYPSASSDSTATVVVNWTANATYGEPDQWRIWNAGWVGVTVAGDVRTATVTGVARGGNYNFRAVPFVLQPDGTYVQAGNWLTTPNAAVTPNVARPQSLVASGVSQVCFSFYGPLAGQATNYTLQYYDTAWKAWGDVTDGGPHCKATTVPIYVRVRTNAPGGASDWAQLGPTSPVNDVTGPGASTISFFGPQASYGRMVVQGNWSADSDTARGEIYFARIGVTNWTLAWQGGAGPSGQIGPIAIGTGAAGEQVGVLIRTFDATGNQGADAVVYYTLEASPAIIDPVDGATGRNGAWRNDSVCSGNEQIFGQTSSGANQGTFFYGDNLMAFCQRRAPGSIQNIQMTYARQTGQGMNAARCPVWYVHNAGTKPATPPALGGNGDQGCCLATGAACTWTLPSYFTDWFRQGWKGLANWNPTGDTNTNYGKLYATGQNALGVVTGRVVINHLG